MKSSILLSISVYALALMSSRVFAQGTAFTYQGRLNDTGQPANGNYDFRFRLASDSLGNNYVGSAYFTNGVDVSNGLFTTALDFGAGLFAGSNYWLEVGVRTNNGGSYIVLGPLQGLTPTPYAIMANTASNLLGTLPAGQLSGTILNAVLPGSPSFSGTVMANSFSGNGANVTNVNALKLNGLGSGAFWQLGGNNASGGQFLGTTNIQALEVRVGGQRALLITPSPSDAANIIGGSFANVIDPGVQGAVIAGGGTTNFFGSVSSNRISENFASIGGGSGNWIQRQADHSVIGAGWNNLIGTNAYQSVIAGGWYNTNLAYSSVIGGGELNLISGTNHAFIGGGEQNLISSTGDHAAVVGGGANSAGGSYAAVVGGLGNAASGNWSLVGGGIQNSATGVEATVGGGYNNHATGVNATVGGGLDNFATNSYATISGGAVNMAGAYGALVGGGLYNSAINSYATISGGYSNLASGEVATVGGGQNNTASGTYSFVGGGYANTAAGYYSFAAGQEAQALHLGTFVWADSQLAPFSSTGRDQFLIRAQGGVGINTSTPNGASLYVSGNRTGDFTTSVNWCENTSTASNARPARRVIGLQSPDGVLSVSAITSRPPTSPWHITHCIPA